ncbi:MAG: DUF4301 family protein [Pseudomonadota bacterium]
MGTIISFSEKDLKDLRARGISKRTALEQLSFLKKGPRRMELVRPCTAGDGIRRLAGAEADEFALTYDSVVARGEEPIKFVPASGAASRLFKHLIAVQNQVDRLGLSGLGGEGKGKAALVFLENLKKFAFWPDLSRALETEGLSPEKVLAGGAWGTLLDVLLTDRGLEYAGKPKGLIPFHMYGANPRTPMEEHLVEAAAYSTDSKGVARVHFTVATAHAKNFTAHLARVKKDYERRFSVRLEVTFSTQEPSTDNLASDLENQPFRTPDGRLLFRPGGHGALLGNLNALASSIIFINNIDNVVTDRDKPERTLWKKVLGGLLWTLSQEARRLTDQLTGANKGRGLGPAMAFCVRWLGVDEKEAPTDSRGLASFLLDRLDRPVRVCGMVENHGDPGGSPFWVRDVGGNLSRQIVESAQVDLGSVDQMALFAASTHFNPVDIVCSIRSPWGGRYDLSRFVDPETFFISRKTMAGRELKALELPGLWNGSMAGWNTVFVQVPLVSFNPVKSINDLLEPSHRQ